MTSFGLEPWNKLPEDAPCSRCHSRPRARGAKRVQSYCPPCHREVATRWRHANVARNRAAHALKMERLRAAHASLCSQTLGESGAEQALRRAVRAVLGPGYRKAYKLAPIGLKRRSADLAWPSLKLAVFFDGCWWHGCPQHCDRRYGANGEYWAEKLRRNVERDAETTSLLEAAGWRVLRVWEHLPLEAALQDVLRAHQEAAAAKG